MGRKRTGDKVDGWLAIDKPAGQTSAAAVALTKRLLAARKAGHAGTLDPLATGVLPIALGEATKTVDHVMRGAKLYRFTVRWGEARDTDDGEGAVVGVSEVRPGAHEIEAVLDRFRGEIEQVPPAYAAVKVGGRRAYDLARQGALPELPARPVRIARLELLSARRDEATFEMECGRGTYVRALARDLGRSLGTLAHVDALRRRRAGPFTEDDAISLDSLAALGHSSARSRHLLPVAAALVDIPALALTAVQADKLRRGETVNVETTDTGVRFAMASGRLVALAEVAHGRARPRRVFNL